MELDVDADEVIASLRPIYLDVRQLAAVVASPGTEPDDVLQEAVARVLATGQWRRIHDLRAYVVRATIGAAATEQRRALDPIGVDGVPEVALVATYPSELVDLDPVTRALLYFVETEDYLVDEAAALVGCSTEDAERRLARAGRPSQLDAMATRGDVRGVEAVVAAAVADASERDAPAPTPLASRRRKGAAGLVLTAAVLIVGVVAVRQRHHDAAPAAVPTPTTSIAVEEFAASARGWVFDQGAVRSIGDDRLAAHFPMSEASSAPVRVEGGFVAVLADRGLWFARQNSTDAVLLDQAVDGVAATPGGNSIAYAVQSQDGRTATLKLLDVATQSVLAQLTLDRAARVVGISNPEVLLDTSDERGNVAAIWDPTNGNRITYLDAFGSVGGVGRNVAVLNQGNRSCGVLVTVRNDAIAPLRNIDLSTGDRGCDPTRWEFDASGSLVAGYRDFEPTELRVSINRFPVAIGSTKVRDAIWVDDEANVAAIDDRNHLVRCDLSARCVDVRAVQPPPKLVNQVWLIAPRRDVADDHTG